MYDFILKSGKNHLEKNRKKGIFPQSENVYCQNGKILHYFDNKISNFGKNSDFSSKYSMIYPVHVSSAMAATAWHKTLCIYAQITGKNPSRIYFYKFGISLVNIFQYFLWQMASPIKLINWNFVSMDNPHF